MRPELVQRGHLFGLMTRCKATFVLGGGQMNVGLPLAVLHALAMSSQKMSSQKEEPMGEVIELPEILNGGRPRHEAGWRSGRPVEDPEKTKRWGLVTAKPSEYLVHCRGGRVRGKSSGQGATCFKWPWDSISIVPTSLQRLSFRADQVTREKVGVEVVGLAVYRIADPLLAFRVLNFSYPERAQEKLEATRSVLRSAHR